MNDVGKLHIETAMQQAGSWIRATVSPNDPLFRLYSDTLSNMRDDSRRSSSKWAEDEQLVKSFRKAISDSIRKPDPKSLPKTFGDLYKAMYRTPVPPDILAQATAPLTGRGI